MNEPRAGARASRLGHDLLIGIPGKALDKQLAASFAERAFTRTEHVKVLGSLCTPPPRQDPEVAFTIEPKLRDRLSGEFPLLANVLPRPAVKAPQPTFPLRSLATGPDNALLIAGDSGHGAGAVDEIPHAPVLQKTETSEPIADPQPIIRCPQRRHEGRLQRRTGRRVKQLEARPIEAIQSVRRADPQVTIGGLGQRGGRFGRAILERPKFLNDPRRGRRRLRCCRYE